VAPAVSKAASATPTCGPFDRRRHARIVAPTAENGKTARRGPISFSGVFGGTAQETSLR